MSLTLDEGDIVGLLGPNGAGKTTLVECIVGLREPDEGDIHLAGVDARRRPRDARQSVGVMLQSTALQDKITPREAVRLFASFYRTAADPEGLLRRFSLADKADAAFDTLSGGQRQRLALALAFVNAPDILFLDEPTAGLDPQSKRDLRDEIARFRLDRRTVLLTTHDVDEAERLCDRVAVMDHGEILATGTPSALIADAASLQAVTIVTTQQVAAERLRGLTGIRDLSCDGNRISFAATDARAVVRELMVLFEATGVELVDLHVRRATLEEVFLRLTRREVES